MNNLTPEAHGLSHLPGIDRFADPLSQRLGEREQSQQTGRDLQVPVVRIEQVQSSGEAQRQFVITVLIGAATLGQPAVGLANSLKGRGGISAYLPLSTVTRQPIMQRPLLYRKNGILVGHTGCAITAEEVANALAEE